MNTKNIGRNDPCPCGSGKKYKQCCQNQLSQEEIHKNTLLASIPDLFTKAGQASKNNDIDTAENLYKEILSINPKHILTLNNIALLKTDQNQLEEALIYLEKALKYEPSGESHANLGIVFLRLKKYDEAVKHLKKAIAMNPGDYTSHNNLGFLYCELNNFKDGLSHLHKAVQLNPTYYLPLYNLGVFLLKQSKYIEAAQYYRRAIEVNPAAFQPRQNYLFCLCFDKSISAKEYLDSAKSLEKLLSKDVIPYTRWNTILAPSKLRIGFVSGDLRNHVVSLFLENILINLQQDHSLELFAYSTTEPKDDEVAERLKMYFSSWHSVAQMTAQQAAKQIHHDQIDILIDLNGHTANSGLSVFTYKPAPIQITWLGYWASTGFSCIDYFFADPIGLPESQQHYFSEKIWYLPETRLCFTPPSATIAPPVNSLPAIKNGYITFGCFQNFSKINDRMLALWSNILKAIPNSKIMFKNSQMKDALIKLELIERFEKFGINESQLLLEGSGTRTEYFHSYHKVDMILDTFPYPGGTTTCEALWMGVPTLTLTGDTVLERQGHSMLVNVQLADWVCESEEDYLQKAIHFANDLNLLSVIRQDLRQQAANSPLMNAERFSHYFSQALHKIWDTHQKTS